MKYSAIISILLASFFSTQLYAKCDQENQMLFFCKIQKNGKLLEVCDAQKTITYSFGKAKKKPELSLAIPRQEVSTYQWAGIGRYENYSVIIPNGDTTYSVFWGVDKLTEDFPETAGVTVEVKGEEVATILCVNKTVKHNLMGVDLKPVED